MQLFFEGFKCKEKTEQLADSVKEEKIIGVIRNISADLNMLLKQFEERDIEESHLKEIVRQVNIKTRHLKRLAG